MNLRTPAETISAGLDLDSHLPFRLLTATNAVCRLIARSYEDRFGLTSPQWRVLCVLAEEGRANLDTVSQRLIMNRPTVGRAAGGLMRRRLAERCKSENRVRAPLLSLTLEGRRLHGEIAPLALAYEAALTAGLAPAEVTEFKRLLARVQAAALGLAG
jgi:DNA-binding MarR family transcriptional regulator